MTIKTLPLIAFLILSLKLSAQMVREKEANAIVAEATLLYRSEMASWHGTDIFIARYPHRDSIGGYFSYTDDNNISKCIFFSKAEVPKVIGTISFDSVYTVTNVVTDMSVRAFTPQEQQLYTIRTIAKQKMETDTIFHFYNNTNLNLIPVIWKGEKKVYMLTGPKNGGVVIIGNDYLLNFDNDNNLKQIKRLHQNIIPIDNKSELMIGNKTIVTAHTHLPETGDFITVTDVCTLMLYQRYTNWQQHVVASPNYINIWHCENNQLIIIRSEDIGKMTDGKKKK